MSNLLLPRRLYNQPQGAVQIDWSNPITSGLLLAYNGASNSGSVTGVVKKTANVKGVGAGIGSVFAGGNGYINIGSSGTIGHTASGRKELTVVALVYRNGAGGAGYGRILDGVDQTKNILFYQLSTGELSFAYYSSAGAHATTNALSGAIGTGVHLFLGASIDLVTSNVYGYVDGKNTASVNLGRPNDSMYSGSTGVLIGNRPDNTRSYDGIIYFAAQFDRILSAAEHASIAYNPWQIFKVSE